MMIKKLAKHNELDFFMSLLIFLLPLGYLTIHRWSDIFAFLLIFVSFVHFAFNKKSRHEINFDLNSIVMICVLMAPAITLFVAQLVSGHVIAAYYDAPSRFIFAIILFFYIRQSTINVGKILQYAIPGLLIFNLLAVTVFHQSYNNEHPRFGTSITDPLTFGDNSIVFGFMVLATINAVQKDTVVLKAFKFFAYFLGLFLSLGSQSRGGWCAFPVLVILYIILNWKDESKKNLLLFVCANIALPVIAFLFIPEFHDRLVYWAYEHTSYVKHVNIDTSEGLRLTMWKISWALFKQHPFFGFGSYQALKTFLTDPNIKAVGTPAAIDALYFCGPHNQVIAGALLAGIFGMISTVTTFFVPFIIFAKRLFSNNSSIKLVSRLGIIYVSGLFVGGMTMEVYNLKYTATFFAAMIAMLTAAAVRDKK